MRVNEFNNIPKHLRDFGPKKGVSFGGVLSSTTYTKLVRAIQQIVGLLHPGGDNQKEKFCCIGFWVLPTAEDLNLL